MCVCVCGLCTCVYIIATFVSDYFMIIRLRIGVVVGLAGGGCYHFLGLFQRSFCLFVFFFVNPCVWAALWSVTFVTMIWCHH